MSIEQLQAASDSNTPLTVFCTPIHPTTLDQHRQLIDQALEVILDDVDYELAMRYRLNKSTMEDKVNIAEEYFDIYVKGLPHPGRCVGDKNMKINDLWLTMEYKKRWKKMEVGIRLDVIATIYARLIEKIKTLYA